MKVSVSQFKSTPDVAVNLATVCTYIAQAAEEGARLVAFPEASLVAYDLPAKALHSHAQRDCAGFVAQVAQTAQHHGVDVFIGVYEPNGSARASNVIVHLNAQGQLAGRYEKVHLYDAFHFQESTKNRPAPLLPDHGEVYVAEVEGLKFGLLNCYDLRFPEIARIAVDKGADALVYSAGWVAGSLKELHWTTLLRARAIENTCFVLAACQPPPESVGMSQVIDANGLTLAGVANTTGLACARIDRARLQEVRTTLPCLAQRRYQIAANTPTKTGDPHETDHPLGK